MADMEIQNRQFSIFALAAAAAIASLLFLILIKAFELNVELIFHSESVPVFLLVLVFVAAAGFMVFGLVDSSWLGSRQWRIRQAIKALRNNNIMPSDIWVAQAADLVGQVVPPTSHLKKTVDTILSQEENDQRKRDVLVAVLDAIVDQAPLRPLTLRSSVLDEAAVLASKGDGLRDQMESFEAKRALYHSFAASWPLRIILILLVFSLGLVGWKTFELAELGRQAKQISDQATQQLEQAKQQLSGGQQQLTEAQGKLQEIVRSSDNTLQEARLAAAGAKVDLASAVQDGVNDVNGASQNGIRTLKEMLENKSEKLQEDLRAIAKAREGDINKLADEKSEALTALAAEHTKALESHFSTLQEQADGSYAEHQKTLDNMAITQAAKLETHGNTKAAELNARTDAIAKRLMGDETNAKDRISAVFDRVEGSEQDRVKSFNQTLTRNEQQIRKLEQAVSQLEEKIQQHKAFANELVNVVNLIERNGSWAKPELLATLLETRSVILGAALLMAFVSLTLSVMAYRRPSGQLKTGS